jgi:hypothetical protein
MNETGIRIIKDIKDIELLRAEILQKSAELNKSMLTINSGNKGRLALISDIIAYCYLLADKIGISYKEVDDKIESQLKINIFREYDSLKEDFIRLLYYLEN